MAIGIFGGCATTGGAAHEVAVAPQESDRRTVTGETGQGVLAEVERRYVIGPLAARELGYRIDWQYPDAGRRMRLLTVQEDAVFALDDRNFLTRLSRDRGMRLWRIPVAEPILEIFGITYVEPMERVYLTSGGAILELDAANGLQVGRQVLQKIANTRPAIFDQFMIYGARNGQLIWHSYAIAFQWRAYQISRSIQIAPRVYDDVVVTIGIDGRITVHDARSARMLWSKRLLGPVVARPAVGGGMVFIAGTDQHVWAYDLYTGRNVWRYQGENRLTEPPALVRDRLYQQIPGEGLVCFEARPEAQLGGVVHWRSPEVTGSVLFARGQRLFVWDDGSKQLSIVDARRGGVINRVSLPQVRHLLPVNLTGDELYASSDDGRIVRLVPQN